MQTAAHIRGRFQALSGLRRFVVLALLGALAALALPPFHAVPMLVPAAVAILWSIKPGRDWRGGFWAAFAVGFGFNVAALYWISHSLLVDPRFAWMIPFMILGFGGVTALYTGAAGALSALAPEGPRRVIAFAVAWTLTEWVRAWALTGFPWNLTATVWAFHPAPLQPAAWVGGYGLGFVTMLLAGAPALLAGTGNRNENENRGARRFALALAALCVVWAAAAGLRLAPASAPGPDSVMLRIVQPNIAQRDKWVTEKRLGHVLDQVVLSSGEGDVDAVIWSETAVPFALNRDVRLRALVGQAAAAAKAGVILTGALGVEGYGADSRKVYNTLYALWPDGRLRHHYNKSHLVPFGEYVPFRDVLPIEAVAMGRGSFTPGPGRVTMRVDGLPPFSPLICYEIMFPGRAYDPADRPEWLLNITNDAWFGYSTGPFQHFAAAVLRAVEEGLPVVRAANTGVSGVIDAHGHVIESLGLEQRGVIDAHLPAALKPTLYGRFGAWAALVWVLALSSALWVFAAGGRKTGNDSASKTP
ncbi:MAG: apolipoprotein N-acyltransferase [Rhodospirillales bacterium]